VATKLSPSIPTTKYWRKSCGNTAQTSTLCAIMLPHHNQHESRSRPHRYYPAHDVWMEGMIRAHRSTGVHDPLYAKALVLCTTDLQTDGMAFISVDVCAISTDDQYSNTTPDHPANRHPNRSHNLGGHPYSFRPGNDRGLQHSQGRRLRNGAFRQNRGGCRCRRRRPGACRNGLCLRTRDTISHYRRLLADDGHVVMNWEPWPAERIVRPLA